MLAFSGNTIPYKLVWIDEYQRTHYKQAVFPMFADMRFEKVLQNGASIKWAYDADNDVQTMGADGSYTVENKTVTDETLTVNQLPTSTNRIPLREKLQDNRPTQQKWAQKAMNRVYWSIDADILGQLSSNAASSLSAGDFGGTSGNPITLSSATAAAIFAAARRKLRNQNVIYDQSYKFQNVIKFDSAQLMPVAAIPAELEEQLLLQIGFKNTELGDTTLKQGYLGMIFGFNSVYSGALPYSFKIAFSATPTAASTITIGGTVIATWQTTLGTTAGNVLAEVNATTSVTNLVNYLNAPYTGVTSKSVPQVRANLTIPQRQIFDKISAVDGLDGSCIITVLGQGALVTSQTDTNGTISKQSVHAIFGTSKSIAVIMQREPELTVSPGNIIGNGSTGGFVAQDFVTWTLAGWKVFLSQTKQIVDVPIDCSTFSSPNNVYN